MAETTATPALPPAPATAEQAETTLDALLDWFQQLSPSSLADIDRYYCADATFKDPFNEVHQRAHIQAIFQHMFQNLQQPRFVIQQRLQEKQQVFVSWDFHFGWRGTTFTIHGGSHLQLDPQGRIRHHRDYWDSSEELLQKLPLIGPLLRALHRKMATKQDNT
ncbi:nuclear transport factor 2 family protein [Neisseriaceae bacterium TC5R-5]|nr:nuclear transport factor 2 family protein [Neisseriaceae bacterium TC5R-5]